MSLGIFENEKEFNPQKNASRSDIAKWLTEAFNLPTDVTKPEFYDVEQDSEEVNYIAAVVKAGFMQGVGNNKFMPDDTLTRAQMAKIAVNIMELNIENAQQPAFNDVIAGKWYTSSVQAVFEAGIIKGTGKGNYEPNRSITKAEASVFIERMLYNK